MVDVLGIVFLGTILSVVVLFPLSAILNIHFGLMVLGTALFALVTYVVVRASLALYYFAKFARKWLFHREEIWR